MIKIQSDARGGNSHLSECTLLAASGRRLRIEANTPIPAGTAALIHQEGEATRVRVAHCIARNGSYELWVDAIAAISPAAVNFRRDETSVMPGLMALSERLATFQALEQRGTVER